MRKTPKTPTKKNMDTKKEKPDKSAERMQEADHEIAALQKVCNAVDDLSDEEKLRVFSYLKSRYAKSFPYEQH